MGDFPRRHAISRARFFLNLAKRCSVDKRDEFEAYLEASIIFGRAALHRLDSKYKHQSNWKPWWRELRSKSAVEFFRNERNWILKEGPPKVGQIIRVGGPPVTMAAELYYYENPQTPATDTVDKHLSAVESLLIEAQRRFPVS
jgi:hypothetical protein